MEFRAVSRRRAEQGPPESRPHVIISVSTPHHDADAERSTSYVDDPADLAVGPGTLGVLRLQFVDLDREPGSAARAVLGPRRAQALFTRAQARQILDFVALHPGAEVVVAHCDMGASRSPAICAALAKIHGGDDMAWFANFRPNVHVYRTLLNEHFELADRQEP